MKFLADVLKFVFGAIPRPRRRLKRKVEMKSGLPPLPRQRPPRAGSSRDRRQQLLRDMGETA